MLMNDAELPGTGLAALGIGAFAVVCCAALPLVAGVLRDTVAQFPRSPRPT